MKRTAVLMVVVLGILAVLAVNPADARTWQGRKPRTGGGSFGVGLGVPYGVLGGNTDFVIAPNLNASLGLGTTGLAGMGYSVGLKYYFIPAGATFRPRASVYYGTNTIVELQSRYAVSYEAHPGVSVGFGGQWMWGQTKRTGLDFDLIYIATMGVDTSDYEYYEEPGRIKMSLGLRRAY